MLRADGLQLRGSGSPTFSPRERPFQSFRPLFRCSPTQCLLCVWPWHCSVTWCRTTLKDHPSFRICVWSAEGSVGPCISCRVLSPSLSQGSGKPSSLNLLHGIVCSSCFPGNPSCNSSHYKDWERLRYSLNDARTIGYPRGKRKWSQNYLVGKIHFTWI